MRKGWGDWVISSAANTGDEVGNPVYPPVRALLEARGISCKGKYSVQLRREDYPNYDYFIGMDARNRPRYAAHLRRQTPKIRSICCWTTRIIRMRSPIRGTRATSARPEAEINEGCAALLRTLRARDN